MFDITLARWSEYNDTCGLKGITQVVSLVSSVMIEGIEADRNHYAV